MTRRRIPLTLAVVGLLIIVAVIIAASVVRSSDTATLTLGERPDAPVVVTEPGVLDAVDPQVTVRATAEDDEPVVLAIGRTSEVEAWLGDADHVRVTGLSSWEELTVETVTGAEETTAPTDEGAPADEAVPTADATPAEPAEGEVPGLPNPAGSDLWVVETVSTGTAELSWTDTPGRWSLVAATDGTAPAPDLELAWGRQVSTPWLVPGIVLGALLLVAGATMLVLGVLADREQRRRDEAGARGGADDADQPAASISDTDPGTGEHLTRRQIREMERAMAQADRDRRAGEPPPHVPLPAAESPAPGEPSSAAEPPAEDGRELGGASDPAAADDGAAPAVDIVAPGGSHAAPGDAVPGGEDAAGDAPPSTRPGTDDATAATTPATGSETQADAVGTDATDTAAPEEDAPGTAPPSWRTVWGFGGASARRGPRPGNPAAAQPDQDDDGEERR